MMFEIAETSTAVMPAGMSATAMALGGGESSSEAWRVLQKRVILIIASTDAWFP